MKDRRGSSSSGAGGVFPFSIGCMSQSSVAVADPQEKTKQQPNMAGLEESGGGGEATSTKAAMPASPGIVTAGVQRLVKGIKSLFAGDEEEEEEEEEQEMVIGYPTDVQHVGHIGWDGLNKVGDAKAMVNAFSLSLRPLEVAMDHAAHA